MLIINTHKFIIVLELHDTHSKFREICSDLRRVVVRAGGEVEEADTEVLFSEAPRTQLTQHVLIHLS